MQEIRYKLIKIDCHSFIIISNNKNIQELETVVEFTKNKLNKFDTKFYRENEDKGKVLFKLEAYNNHFYDKDRFRIDFNGFENEVGFVEIDKFIKDTLLYDENEEESLFKEKNKQRYIGAKIVLDKYKKIRDKTINLDSYETIFNVEVEKTDNKTLKITKIY